MSKSKGHDLSVKGILAQWYDPLDVRYFYLTAHYRSFLDFSWEALDQASKTRKNLIKKIYTYLSNWTLNPKTLEYTKIHGKNQWWALYMKLCETMGDDLNTVEVLSLIHQSLHHASAEDIKDILLFDDYVTKVWLRKWVEALNNMTHQEIPENIKNLAEQRLQAKQEKDWATADRLRDELKQLWRIVKDTGTWYELEVVEQKKNKWVNE